LSVKQFKNACSFDFYHCVVATTSLGIELNGEFAKVTAEWLLNHPKEAEQQVS
jgi:hypothetical protein